MPNEQGPPPCPHCGHRVARLVYGRVRRSAELQRALDAGEVVLAGCVVGVHRWACTGCGARYADAPEPGRDRPDGSTA
ncbi:hypothetical protein GCM10023191_097940 [Actinoallomurus oryzae]|uniref:Uncharacterized protein n=1 Tax=Actinoallomurus oryzae TaxID=502180 RepID=A0ABP8R7X3_9ACTN